MYDCTAQCERIALSTRVRYIWPKLTPPPLSGQAYGPEPLSHPFLYMLMLGQDARGDYVPCKYVEGGACLTP